MEIKTKELSKAFKQMNIDKPMLNKCNKCNKCSCQDPSCKKQGEEGETNEVGHVEGCPCHDCKVALGKL